MYPTYKALGWFRGLVLLGLFLNAAFFLPGLFAPRLLETWFDFGITNTVHWLQNVSLLLIIVTAMYIPVMRDPFRYIFITYLVVGGRFAAGSLFFFGVLFMDYPEGMMTLAMGDLMLSTAQAYCVYQMLREGDPEAGWA
ncbi:MAG: hypothetical protein AAGH68_08115 [Pseudomonadota bacterium]